MGGIGVADVPQVGLASATLTRAMGSIRKIITKIEVSSAKLSLICCILPVI